MPLWFQFISACVALIGAVLGVFATWRSIVRDHPRLQLRVVWCYPQGGSILSSRQVDAPLRVPQGFLGIEAVNMGHVPVRIREFGLCRGRFLWRHRFTLSPLPKDRTAIHRSAETWNEVWKVEPGENFCMRMPPGSHLTAVGLRRTRPYLITETDRLFFGHSPMLQRLADEH